MLKLLSTCKMCGKETTLEVEREDYAKYQAGGLVQSCFPYLNADQRELLISGICPSCFNNLFPEG